MWINELHVDDQNDEYTLIPNTQKDVFDIIQNDAFSSGPIDISQVIYLVAGQEIHNEEGNVTKFICKIGEDQIGSISVTWIGDHMYSVGGAFVDPRMRGRGISSNLIKKVNQFLEENNSLGILFNTIIGLSASVYENNGRKRWKFESHWAYGAYQYTFDCRK